MSPHTIPTKSLTRAHAFAEMFAATGWRVGWLIGPASIIQPTLAATTRIVFCSNSPLQEASAVGLEQAKKRGFLEQQRREYTERRNILTAGFDKLGMKYTNPQGSYFVLLVRDPLRDWTDGRADARTGTVVGHLGR